MMFDYFIAKYEIKSYKNYTGRNKTGLSARACCNLRPRYLPSMK